MGSLQATWCPPGRLLFWANGGEIDEAVAASAPELASALGDRFEHGLIGPRGRVTVVGRTAAVGKVLPLLPALAADEGLSDTVRCWAMASRLGLELAARQAVVPSVVAGEARWRALVSRPQDRKRFEELAAALPVAARAIPCREGGKRGPPRIPTAEAAVRGFLDEVGDSLYRQAAWPGPARGWALELADALRGAESSFTPRDARFQGVPAALEAWAGDDRAAGVQLGMTLMSVADRAAAFRLHLWLAAVDESGAVTARVPITEAWRAGEGLQVGDRSVRHPSYRVLRALARARRICPALGAAVAGEAPQDLVWSTQETWAFLGEGVPALQDAGFIVELPEVFAAAGSRRIRARMHLLANEDGGIHLGEMLSYRWEVVLGDKVLSGADFAEVLGAREPIARFRGEWVLLDPAELERLPAGLPQEGRLEAAAALRAILTGQHEGVPVVVDDRLALVVDALRNPPSLPPPPALRATLRPYQELGFSWLACLGELGVGACLADDMGLGKTVQVIAYLLHRHGLRRGEHRPALVVCPTSLLGNWTRELQRFAPGLRVARHHGLARDVGRASKADVVLTTYGLLVRDEVALHAVNWDTVVLDEAQAIKNPESRRARAAYGLTARHKVAMSGTPVENRLDELWALMRFLVPGLLGARAHFQRTVAIPVERFGDEVVAHRLRLGTSPFLLRRVKSDPTIVRDLPDKVERRDYCVLTSEQAKLYQQVVDEHFLQISGLVGTERRGQVLAMLTALKQVCNHPAQWLRDGEVAAKRSGKLQRTSELLQAVVDAGDAAIVFTQYREMGHLLVSWLERTLGCSVPFLHGGVVSTERDSMVARFQTPEGPPILVISLRAGGTGLNLTRATHVVHYDRWWNPAVEDQATDRAYRIGQHRNVQVHKLVCQGTLEERVDAMLEEKRALAEAVVGGGERLITELDDQALRALVALGEDAVLGEDE